jgi:hypothetical protein
MTTKELVAESNRIEGIHRAPTAKEIETFDVFVNLKEVTVQDLENFVNVYQPGAKLRDRPGMDVGVGSHFPPRGGAEVREQFIDLVARCNDDRRIKHKMIAPRAAYQTHLDYESLHPFIDGNGRSGRMLWYWMMRNDPIAQELGFLHTFYYQTLENSHD